MIPFTDDDFDELARVLGKVMNDLANRNSGWNFGYTSCENCPNAGKTRGCYCIPVANGVAEAALGWFKSREAKDTREHIAAIEGLARQWVGEEDAAAHLLACRTPRCDICVRIICAEELIDLLDYDLLDDLWGDDS